jgi:tetraacyldisaccharide 4'-kinase
MRHGAAEVGDEPLLLARVAPTWVAADRAAGARAAIAAGARVLVMDDGLQNPTLAKDMSLLVIDGASGFGTGRVIPAGPLREPIAAAAARCAAAVLIGQDATGALALLPQTLPVLRARLVPGPRAAALSGRPVFAFAGIALPGKFHATLMECGAVVVGSRDFPDHHPYTEAELRQVLEEAARLKAIAVTTPKDAVRLPYSLHDRVEVVDVRLAWDDPVRLDALLAGVLGTAA